MSNPEQQYTVIARRYRPTLFADLVGQDHIARALSNAITQNRVGHAYLFTGARGVGKTSSARIFAKCLNCVKGPTPEPCNECDICQAVSAGEDVDVLEIDGASNRGIDEIRQLRSNAGVRPSRAKFKIYIIDEVHMLTSQAFNALLKTLEEPPGHVKFIFCTTDPQKIPITVLSRCQRFDFSPVRSGDITDRLAEIAKNENIVADREALALLARRAGGSMRDSQSLLEQLFSFCGDDITVDDVNQLLGTADMSRIAEIAAAMAGRDAATSLGLINTAIVEGVDAGQLAAQMLGFYRDMMTVRAGCGEETLLSCSGPDMAALRGTGDELGLETILATLQILDGAVVRMQSSVHTRTLLEVAVVRICNLEKLESISSLVEALAGGAVPVTRNRTRNTGAVKQAGKGSAEEVVKKNVTPDAIPASAPETEADNNGVAETGSSKTSSPNGVSINARGTVIGESAVLIRETAAGVVKPAGGPATIASAGMEHAEDNEPDTADNKSVPAENGNTMITLTADTATEVWERALAGIEDMTADIASHYAKLEVGGEGKLVVTLNDSYNRDLCARADRKQKLESAVQAVTGRAIRIDFRAAEPGTIPTAAPAPGLTRRQQILQLNDQPFVKRAMETFDAEIVNFRTPGQS